MTKGITELLAALLACASPGLIRVRPSDLQIIARFARDVVEDKLDEVSRFKIESFFKQEVYRRFALDILSSHLDP